MFSIDYKDNNMSRIKEKINSIVETYLNERLNDGLESFLKDKSFVNDKTKMFLYHGTSKKPNEFKLRDDYDFEDSDDWSGELPSGVLFLTNDLKEAFSYGRYVIPCELRDYSTISFKVYSDNPSREFDKDYGIDLYAPDEYIGYYDKFLDSGKSVLEIKNHRGKATIITYIENIIPRIDLAKEFYGEPVHENLILEKEKIDRNKLPQHLYHVTTNYDAVIESGVLRAKSGMDSGGLGGTESHGVSFVLDQKTAKIIYDELELINQINNSKSEDEALSVVNNIGDYDRKEFVLSEYKRTISVYKDYITTLLMALRITRNSLKFQGKSFYGIIIFNEKNIRNKNIGIIKVNSDNIPLDVDIVKGVDEDFNEIRVLGDVPLD